jgi:hypothetical protein
MKSATKKYQVGTAENARPTMEKLVKNEIATPAQSMPS